MKNLWMSLFAVVLFTGCLKTRTDVKEVETKQVISQQVSTLQRTNADTNNRIAELEQEVREINGKVEVLESKLGRQNPDTEKNIKGMAEQLGENNKRMAAYQEELLKQEAMIKQLSQDIENLKTELTKAPEKVEEKKTPLQLADEHFKQNDWKKAIIQYQKYRDENPKGKKLPEATYRIAYAFGELGMKDEAKTFYEEVISKFPASGEAKKAKAKIKAIKK
jgi:TolA-binding protein